MSIVAVKEFSCSIKSNRPRVGLRKLPSNTTSTQLTRRPERPAMDDQPSPPKQNARRRAGIVSCVFLDHRLTTTRSATHYSTSMDQRPPTDPSNSTNHQFYQTTKKGSTNGTLFLDHSSSFSSSSSPNTLMTNDMCGRCRNFLPFLPGRLITPGVILGKNIPPGYFNLPPGGCAFTEKKQSPPRGENKATYGTLV